MTIRTVCIAIAPVALLIAGCSSSSNPLSSIGSTVGSITGSNKVGDTDRVFLMAAGSWDKNRDSTVTCDEWKSYATELFNSADASRDDSVDATEWPAMVKTDRMFSTADLRYFDANGDGKVTRDEMLNKPNPAFKLMDTGNTCTLNSTQIAGARSKTEYDVSGKKKEDGDVREATGERGRAANSL